MKSTFEKNHPVLNHERTEPADDDISPYLRRPLRTLEQAQQHRKHWQRQAISDLPALPNKAR